MKQAHPAFAAILGIATGLGILMIGQMSEKDIRHNHTTVDPHPAQHCGNQTHCPDREPK